MTEPYDYWAAEAERWAADRLLVRKRFVFEDRPLPSVRGALSVVVARDKGGYRWRLYKREGLVLTAGAAPGELASGWNLSYGAALRAVEAAAVAV